ncbi:MAG: hypothetical protein ACRD96_06640, partial [Bryobacteraceae bacterium]
MKDIWEPNGPGDDITGVNNYKTSYFWFIENWNFNNRTDWNISDRWKLFGRYSRLRTDLDQINYTPNNSRAMPNDNGGLMNSRNIAADTVYTINATTILNLRGSFASLEDDYNAPREAVGEKGLAEIWPSAWYKPYLKDIPAIYYPNISISPGGSYGKGSYWVQHPRSYNFSGKLSKIIGKHYLKWGAETRLHRADGIYPFLMNFAFSPSFTSSTFIGNDTRNTGDAHASFLLGALSGADGQAQLISSQAVHMNYYSLFVHNDYKLNRRVTLNVGLRWEYETPPVDEQNRFSRFLDLTNPIPEMRANPPAIPADVQALRTAPAQFNGAWVFTDDDHRGYYRTEKRVLMPRLGLALRVNDRTAVQIGYAKYVTPPLVIADTIGRLTFAGFNARSTTLPSVEGVPQALLADPFPADRNPLIPAVGKAWGRYTNLGGPASWWQQDLRTQVNDRFNFTVQRELRGGFKSDVTFFTNYGKSLPYSKNMNMSDPQLRYTHKAVVDQAVANPFYRYMTPDTFPGVLRNQVTVRRESLLSPYPQYTGLTQSNTAGPRNRYRALQM